MAIFTRFAPSPTGRLHVGNARTALANWLLARQAGGRFLLRLDDTDLARSDPALARGIELDLRWLGLDWDGFVRQSERTTVHEAGLAELRAAGLAYPCYETTAELEAKRRAARAAGRAPVYDRAALTLGPAERARLEAAGRTPHWRFRVPDGAIAWDDLIQGRKRFESAVLSDPVLRRADGTFTYIFASAADDAGLGNSHVIRGEDHVTNTAVQIALIEALGGTVPAFAHLPLIVDAEGRALSKRIGSLSLEKLRAEGVEPAALAGYLMALGTGEAPALGGLADLAARFDLGAFGRAPPRFDLDELRRVSAQVLHAMSFEEARSRLQDLGVAGIDQQFWEVVRPNLDRLDDVRDWWAICHEPLRPVVEEPAYLAEAAGLLPPGDLDQETAERWVQTLKERTGRKGRALFRPLRLALTAREHGPALPHLIPIIGRERVLGRLDGRTV